VIGNNNLPKASATHSAVEVSHSAQLLELFYTALQDFVTEAIKTNTLMGAEFEMSEGIGGLGLDIRSPDDNFRVEWALVSDLLD